MKENETNKILYALAMEVKNLSANEKLLHLKWVMQAEVDGGKNYFWLALAKKMLLSEEFTDKVLITKNPVFLQ